MRFAGCIFDVEGTLIDCMPQTFLSLHFGLSIPYDTLQLYIGLDGDQALQLLAPSLDASTRNEILDAKASHDRETYLSGIKAFREVRVALQVLKDSGVRIALATDCKGPELKRYLSLLDVSDLLDTMACGDDVEHGKPDPRLVGLALKKLGVPGPQVVMIGDTPYGRKHGCCRHLVWGIFQGDPPGSWVFSGCAGGRGPDFVPSKGSIAVFRIRQMRREACSNNPQPPLVLGFDIRDCLGSPVRALPLVFLLGVRLRRAIRFVVSECRLLAV
jgi:phosphoglycolate phosphatase-like HAD superfamily hydrolase